jgi:hypothetical protein
MAQAAWQVVDGRIRTPDARRTVTDNARTLAFDTHQFGSE